MRDFTLQRGRIVAEQRLTHDFDWWEALQKKLIVEFLQREGCTLFFHQV